MKKRAKVRLAGGVLVLTASALAVYLYGVTEAVLIWAGIIGFYMLTTKKSP